MTWKVILLYVLLQLSSIAIAINNFSTDKNDILIEDNKKSVDSIKNHENLQNGEDENSKLEIERSEDLDFAWIQFPLLPVAWAKSSSLPEGPCKKQAQLYLRHLKNDTLWAAQMYDASTKYPDGIINGNTRHLGDFDLCYHLKTNISHFDDEDESLKKEDEEIAGRYCLVNVNYDKQGLPPVDPSERLDVQFDPKISVWEAIREKGDFRRVRRYRLQMALCVPEVCTPSEIELALQEPFSLSGIKQDISFNVSVQPQLCQTKKEAPTMTRGGKIYCGIVIGLFVLVAMSTWYDYSLKEYNQNNASTFNHLILCFSARRNFNSLMEVTSSHPGLDTIHLTRFFFTMLVLLGHRTIEYYVGPTVNVAYAEWLYTFRRSMPVIAGPQVVEGFFSIGGLLVSYIMLTELDKIKKLYFTAAILIRFLRLTPAYALVVFFHIFVLPSTGTGPYWKWKIGQERDACATNWWANILYINNYVNPDNICMFQTWYVSTDYQLFILALLVVYAFWRMPRKIGYPFLCLIVLAGCFVPFANTYWFGVPPMYRGLLSNRDLREDRYFIDHYVKSHERIASYFIGVIAGAVLYDHKRNPWKLSKVCSNVCFIFFAVVLSLGSEYAGYKYFDPNENYEGIIDALYAASHRAVFAISCCSIVVLITVGQGLTFHYNFLTPRWVQPLGRLTYGAFLTHHVFQLHDVGTRRTGRQYNISNMFWDNIPDAMCAFLAALLLSLTVEGPIRRIEKFLIMKREKSKICNGIKEEAKKGN